MRQIDEMPVNITLDDANVLPTTVFSPSGNNEPIPAMIVIHDILGWNKDTQRICRVLANGPQPMLVIAPDLYRGLGPKPICVARTIRSLKRRGGVTFERLKAVHRWLTSQPIVNDARIGVMGFCIGGGFALLYAADAEIRVVAPFYGDVPADPSTLGNICPVVGGYGAKDKPFAPQGARLKQYLEAQGVAHDVVIYPETGHSYMNQLTGIAKLAKHSPLHAEFNEDASHDSWQRLFSFLDKHL